MKCSKIPHLTKKLISLKTLPKNRKQIENSFKIINQLLKSDGILTRLLKSSNSQLLWSTNKDFTQPDILILCHIDVVDGSEFQFNPKIKQGKIFGRGAFDMKGSLVSMLSTLTQLKTNKNCQLLITSDEEIGGLNGAKWFFQNTDIKPKIAIVPDGLNQAQIILKQKGPMHLTIESKGKSSHASKPWLGKNPIQTLFRIKNQIESIEKRACSDNLWLPSFTITNFEANSSINQIPEKATMTLDIRITNSQQINSIKQIIKEEGAKTIKEFGDAKIFNQKNTKSIKKWQKIARSILRHSINTTHSSGGSDARHLPKQTEVIITQAKGENPHGKNEWVDIDSLTKLSMISKKFIETI